MTDAFRITKGLLFKAKPTIENENIFKNKTFGSFNNTTYSPSLAVVYYSTQFVKKFYSKYDHNKVYTSQDSFFYPYETTNSLQKRMNCYGYAFGYICDGYVLLNNYEGYKQQPGFLCYSDPWANLNIDYETFYHPTPTELFEAVNSNLFSDAGVANYSIITYVPSSGIPEQFIDDSRLVALVVGRPYSDPNGAADFHFYMQHSDGTWSHKPGSERVSNRSIDTDYILTNENIYDCAREGGYDYSITFYKITQRPQWDCTHTNTYSLPSIVLNDEAGDYFESPKQVPCHVNNGIPQTTNLSGKLNYIQDEDYYYLSGYPSKNYTFSLTHVGTQNIKCILYSFSGSVIAQSYGTSTITFSANLSPSNQYYVIVSYNESNLSNRYLVAYTLNIS